MPSRLRIDAVERVRSRAAHSLRAGRSSGAAALDRARLLATSSLDATTLTDLMHASADAVLTALGQAGVPHHLTGMTRDDHYAVAVDPAHTAAAVEALVNAGRRDGATVTLDGDRITSLQDLPTGFPAEDTRLLVTAHAQGLLARSINASRAACVVFFGEASAPEAPAAAARPTLPLPVPFPVDVVYTWVDGADPAWQERKRQALREGTGEDLNLAATAESRYLNRDELKYSLRSLWQFAPWVRHVYLVTDDQVPSWLDPTNPRLTVVPHREIFDPSDALPVFNSHAIESQLHHIDGLSEHYLYLNDDYLFGRPVDAATFFSGNGVAKYFESKARIPLGPATVDDAPVDAAAKNVRALLHSTFGRTVTLKFRHAPQPQRRSVLYEMEERYPEAFSRTARSRFRHPSDISIPSAMQHHYAYLTGRSLPGHLTYHYIGLNDHHGSLAKILRLLVQRHVDCYCLNDGDVPDADLSWADETLAEFLPRYYPYPSEFERR